MQPSTRIQICGLIVVEIDDIRIEKSLPRRQGRLAFAYLVLNRHRIIPRSELIEALWSTGGPDDTEAALNVVLSRLRKVLAPARIEGRGTVRLVLDNAWVDIEAAEDAIHRAESAVVRQDWVKAWAASQGAMFTARRGFLPGEDAEWIDEVRRRLEMLHVRALEVYGSAGLGLGGTEIPAAREAGRTLVQIATLRESGHRMLMRAYAAEGNVAEALRVYECLRINLRDELGISPSEPTERLYEELLG